VKAILDKGSGGVFDVTVDGALIFSKHAVGRFPTHDEVLAKIPGA
jgi:selT/selW/selH-like putative selenoprotein